MYNLPALSSSPYTTHAQTHSPPAGSSASSPKLGNRNSRHIPARPFTMRGLASPFYSRRPRALRSVPVHGPGTCICAPSPPPAYF
ncbi:hypothetical protein OH76DRAFT_1413100 [Lentinus brumalis]|uniref:Uncharacterized protein n=1 Tax=Lentinus brumalis TaxID=2498619 RepID=A0A371CIZ2_9APHY|nr:hypothetical protein OH76DRAFT_1413100 [Polyporus brumalis]